jgi:outer membrane lipoprotein SlyB
MGVFGQMIGGAVGGLAGSKLGGKKGKKAGQQIGRTLGSLVPYKNGGFIKRNGPAMLHAGEIVVPKKLVKHVSKTLKAKIRANQK